MTPDFIGIGAQKAGTSWLARSLRRHPRIWLAPVKEVHYFDRFPRYPSPSHLAVANPVERLLGRGPCSRASRKVLFRRCLSLLRHPGWRHLLWECRFVFGTYGDDWYRSLFQNTRGQVAGEITPAYSLLDRSDVAEVKRVAPDAKIIFVMRNPIERAWSQFRFGAAKRGERRLSVPSVEGFSAMLAAPRYALRSNYARTIRIWREYFCEEQMLLGFYDEIQDDAQLFLRRVMAFLGVEMHPRCIASACRRRVNVSPSLRMPQGIREVLVNTYAAQIRELAELAGGCYPSR